MQLLKQYLEYVAPLKGSIRYHKWSFISIIAALLERRCWLDRGRLGVLFPNMYVILVGNPASGKSTAAELAVNFLPNVKLTNKVTPFVGATKITQAALYKDLKDAERRYPVPGHGTLTSSPLFIYASELGINLTDFGGGTLTNELIDFYDSKGLSVVMKKRTIKEGGYITLNNPGITLLGCTTQDFLQDAAQQKLVTSGLASRIIFAVENNFVTKEYDLVRQDKQQYNQLLYQMTQIFELTGPMIYDDAAQAAQIEIAKEADRSSFEANSTFYQHYYGRKPSHIAKIAMCFAGMELRKLITLDDIKAAKQLIEDIEPEMLSAFGMRTIEKDDNLAAQILHALPVGVEMTKGTLLSNLMKHGKFLPSSSAFEGVMKTLSSSRVVKVQITANDEIYERLY